MKRVWKGGRRGRLAEEEDEGGMGGGGGGRGGGCLNSFFLSLTRFLCPPRAVSLTVSQKRRESVLMVCQIMLLSPTQWLV